MKSIITYVYAIILILISVFKLPKAKKLFDNHTSMAAQEQIFATPKIIARKIIEQTGTAVHVTGQEKLPDGAVLFVANHQGLFDILALLGYAGKPIGFIAKKEIQKLPIVRTWMQLLHCVFIDRENRREAVKTIDQGIANLKNGHSMVIFPEGTRSRGSNLNTFKSGSLRLATKANVPIVPVAIDGTYPMFEEGNGWVKGSTIFLSVEEPIYPDAYQNKNHKELASMLQGTIEASIKSNHPWNKHLQTGTVTTE